MISHYKLHSWKLQNNNQVMNELYQSLIDANFWYLFFLLYAKLKYILIQYEN